MDQNGGNKPKETSKAGDSASPFLCYKPFKFPFKFEMVTKQR